MGVTQTWVCKAICWLPLVANFGSFWDQAFWLGLGLVAGLGLGKFSQPCLESALCRKALARAPYFSNLGLKPSVWGWVWVLTWIWPGFAKPVGNQLWALRLWLVPLTFPIWALSLLFGFGFGA